MDRLPDLVTTAAGCGCFSELAFRVGDAGTHEGKQEAQMSTKDMSTRHLLKPEASQCDWAQSPSDRKKDDTNVFKGTLGSALVLDKVKSVGSVPAISC